MAALEEKTPAEAEVVQPPCAPHNDEHHAVDDVFHIGEYHGRNVYHLVTKIENQLAAVRTWTGIPGFRYLLNKVEGMEPENGSEFESKVSEDVNTGDELVKAQEAPYQDILFANEFFEVRQSSLGGYGAFAAKPLPERQPILVELPLLRTNSMDLMKNFANLSPYKQNAFRSLHAYHPNPSASHLEAVWNANAFETHPMNSAYAIAARFNHACPPANNVKYAQDRPRGVIVLTTSKPVEDGQELTISYGGTSRSLLEKYGFQCSCGACSGVSNADAVVRERGEW